MKNGKRKTDKFKINIFFHANLPTQIKKNENILRKIASKTLHPLKSKNVEISIIITSGNEMKKLNRKFLSKNRQTDVIAFNYPNSPGETKIFLNKREPRPWGDVFVCFDKARKQAKELGHSTIKEVIILVIHGCLHLLGYKDYTPKDKMKMDKATNNLIRKYVDKCNGSIQNAERKLKNAK